MKRTKKQVVELIQQFLIDKEMTVQQLAALLGVCKQSVYRWMDGSRNISTRHYTYLEAIMRDYEPHWVIDMDETKLKEYLWNKEKE